MVQMMRGVCLSIIIIMFKLVTVVTVLSLLAFSAFFLHKYIPYRKLIASSPYHSGLPHAAPLVLNSSQTDSILAYLQELSDMPLIGVLFDETKIKELVRLQRYEDIIAESQKLLQKSYNHRSFSIWYYKALAECYLDREDECQGSLNKASLYSGNYLHRLMIQQLQSYLQAQLREKEAVAVAEEEGVEQLARMENRKRKKLEQL